MHSSAEDKAAKRPWFVGDFGKSKALFDADDRRICYFYSEFEGRSPEEVLATAELIVKAVNGLASDPQPLAAAPAPIRTYTTDQGLTVELEKCMKDAMCVGPSGHVPPCVHAGQALDAPKDR
jgi:hypothetical protein